MPAHDSGKETQPVKRPALCILMEPITHSQACWLLYEFNVLIHGIQKHESSVHIILVYGQRAEPTPSYLRAACLLSTLSRRCRMALGRTGNSRPVKDKRLFDQHGILLSCGWSCMVAERASAKGLHSLIRRDCRKGKREEQHPCVCGCQQEQSPQLFAIKNAECVHFQVSLIASFCNRMGGHGD